MCKQLRTRKTNMTIPSRPAPAPPQQRTSQQQQNESGLTIKLPPPPTSGSNQNSFHSKCNRTVSALSRSGTSNPTVTRQFPAARYAPATNWNGSPFETSQVNSINHVGKKAAPPRPPPPRIPMNISGSTVLKKPGPPQSVNVLSNLFGRKKNQLKNKQLQSQQIYQTLPPPKVSSPLPVTSQTNYQSTRFTPMPSSMIIPPTADTNDVELIKFDSPPSSPTFTQKSNSDCVSVDSFSSDSNFSSPNNGSVSQPESGFEDDFISPLDPFDPFTSMGRHHIPNDLRFTQPVRNLNAINRNQNDNHLCNGKSLLPPQEMLTMPTIIRPKSSFNMSSNHSSPVHSVFNNINSQSPSMLMQNSYETSPNVWSNSSYPSFDTISSMPMPSCPPPPPPPNILDVINGQIDAVNLSSEFEDNNGPSYGIAVYDFEGAEDGDLNFKENEKVYLLKRLNDEWYFGRNKRGCEGMFPSNYIEVRKPLQDIASANYMELPTNNISTTIIDNQPKVKAIYNFDAETPEDLSLKENDLVTVLHRINEDWLYGQIGNQRGQFPANFIEYIPENLSQKNF